jgi:hypothetical protein
MGAAMRDMERRHLAQADRNIAECKAPIARQEKFIWQMRQRGQETAWAQDTLEAFQSSLRAFGQHRKNDQLLPPTSNATHSSEECVEAIKKAML